MFDPMFLANGNHSFGPTLSFGQSVNSLSTQHLFKPEADSDLSRVSVSSPANGGNFNNYPVISSLITLNSPVPLLSVSNSQQQYSNNTFKVNEREGARPGTSDNASTETSDFVCQDCGKVFTEHCLLVRHRVSHAGAKYVCHLCNRPFVRDDKLKRHIRCVHSSERPYKCEVCTKAFARKDKLQEHARHHNRDITFTCPVCSEMFVMRSHLNRHLRNVHKLKVNSGAPTVDPAKSSSLTIVTNTDHTECKSAFTPVNGGYPIDSVLYTQPSSHLDDSLTPITSNLGNRPARSHRKSSTQRRPVEVVDATLGQNGTQTLHLPITDIQSTFIPAPVNFGTSSFFHPSIRNQSQSSSLESRAQCNATQRQLPVSAVSGTYGNQYRQPFVDHQLVQQRPQPTPSTAWSAAMAASLFAPVNYVGWWPQPNSNFMISNQSTASFSGTPSIYNNDSTTARTDSTRAESAPSNYSQTTCDNLANPSISSIGQSRDSDPSTCPANYCFRFDSCQGSPLVHTAATPAHVFASLPSFAQAMYYQAASWVATQNGVVSTESPNTWETNPHRFTSPHHSVPSTHNNQ